MADSFSILLPYTGGRRYSIIPQSGILPKMKYALWGGGGGAGGRDSNLGGDGAGGGFVEGEIEVRPDDLVEVFVGQGGLNGLGGSNRAGGVNGKSHKDYSGGRGGNSGPAGSSGSGGGGGGATALFVKNALHAMAGGGGGGGGGGNRGPFPAGQSANGSYIPQGLATTNTYSVAPTVGVYVALLNQYGVWDGNGTYTWNVFFPSTTTYRFDVAVDNYGYIAIDGNIIATSLNWDYVASGTTTVTEGWHTVSVYAVNYGGAASLAGRIVQGTTEIWNSRASRSPQRGQGFNGGNCPSDGGGGGGGGGGYRGGPGGAPREFIDNGGYAGANGLNFIAGRTPQTTGQYGNFRTPGGSTNLLYPGGVARGGVREGAAGENGYAVLTFFNSSGVYVMENGVYVPISPSTKVGTGFTRTLSWAKIGGIWREISADSDITFSSDSLNWGG